METERGTQRTAPAAVVDLATLPLVMSVAQAASVLGQAPSTAYEQLAAGTWPLAKCVLMIGSRKTVSRYLIEGWLRAELAGGRPAPVDPNTDQIEVQPDGSRLGWDSARREWFDYDRLAQFVGVGA